jgi:hypothetical protein
MIDRELLEMAAKAAGYEIEKSMVGGEEKLYLKGDLLQWNPLTDDGDALRLAVRLNLALLFPMCGDSKPQVGAGQVGSLTAAKIEDAEPDKCAATRRAIVRAAAEIGKAMP